jgi:hypothetical protein
MHTRKFVEIQVPMSKRKETLEKSCGKLSRQRILSQTPQVRLIPR